MDIIYLTFFINDFEIYLDTLPVLFKHGDDPNIIAPVWKDREMSDVLLTQFLDWTGKEVACYVTLANVKNLQRGNHESFTPIFGISSCKYVNIRGDAFQNDCKLNTYVKNKLVYANKCLYDLRSLRNEGYKQTQIDLLFHALVLPSVTYALSVHGASESDLTPVYAF